MAIQHINLEHQFNNANYVGNQVLFEFGAFSIFNNRLRQHREYLIENSEYIKFDKDIWRHRPDTYCLDYYNDPYIWPVIITINNLRSYFDFTPESVPIIITPNYQAIQQLLA